MRGGARGLGEQLASETDTEDRGATLKLLTQERLFGCQPSMLVVLIDMHRPPKDHECVEIVGGRPLTRHPGRKIAEHPGARIRLVDYREDSHSGVT